MYNWLFNTTFGNIDQMRIELESRFNGQQVWIKSYDNKNIDAMFIPSNLSTEQIDQFQISPNTHNPNNRPTIVFCNPNAGYYEFSYFQVGGFLVILFLE